MKRQYATPAQRDRAALVRADAECRAGIPDRDPIPDTREAFPLSLKACGYHDLRIEPRLGYVAWRAVREDTGEVLHSAALKELLHWIADRMPRWLALRNYQ